MTPLDIREILRRPLAYRLWQAPFARRKLVPLLAHNDLSAVGRVLDVGCGPGTNARLFAGPRTTRYLGVDLSKAYAAHSRRRTGCPVTVADARRLPLPRGSFDCVLVNSVLHHVDTPGVHAVLADLARVLSPGGHLHVLDLVFPPERSVARLFAQLDRGRHARVLEEWRELFTTYFVPVAFVPYTVRVGGVACLSMVYFKGRTPA